MAGGTISITVDSYAQLVPVTQTVLCWAAADRAKVRLDTQGRLPRVVIPEEIIAGKGSLLLRIGGADLVSGYVAASHVTFSAGNQNPASSMNPNTCTAKGAAGPGASFVIAGRQVTVTVANGTNGTVKINWGDGTAETTGVAQTGSSAHTYAQRRSYTITITDESDAVATASFVVTIP